ncbi:MAG: Mur ligase domain-containing protein, partial [Gammaproteobacteria bacterium]|nr:Mur ligase domain-containing protein [Gammaproteobacteria bacterium]
MSMPAELIAHGMTLDELLAGIADAPRIGVTGISSDSRKLSRGNLFLACQGETSHGLDYAAQAEEAGVAAIAWDSATASAVDVS